MGSSPFYGRSFWGLRSRPAFFRMRPTLRPRRSRRSTRLEKLGRALFGDRNLSVNRTQSCVSCHSPDLAFTDPKELGKIEGAVSVGADGHSFGDRNSPSVAYASFTPEFHTRRERRADGRLFLGRPRPHA